VREIHRRIAICYVGWLFDFYDLAIISYLLPDLAKSFHLSGSQESWLLGSALGASGVGGIIFGALADRFGRKKIMTWTIVMYSVGTGLSALAPTASLFIFFRALAGLGLGGEWAVGHALIAESSEKNRRGRAAALLQSGEPVGVALAALAGLLLTPLIGWRVVLLLSSLTAFWAIAVRRYLPESPLWEKEQTLPPTFRAAKKIENRKWLLSPTGLSLMFRGFLVALFKLATYWTCYVWLPKLFLERFHEPLGRSAFWILSTQVGQWLGMLLFGRISDRVGRRLTFTAYSCLTSISLFLLAFHWESLIQNRVAFWWVLMGLGIGSGCTAGFGALLSELFPTGVRNFAMGTVYNLARGAQIFAPVVVAAAMHRADVKGALMVPLVFALLTATFIWTLPETKNRNLAEI
jgi:MFS family permease